MGYAVKHCCASCGYVNWHRIGLVLAIFFTIILSMALVQLWIESRELEGQGCKLFDTGQFILGKAMLNFMSSSFFSSIADVWVAASVVGFFFWLGLDFSHPEREFGRFFIIWGLVYFQRALAIGATRYPLLAGNEPFVPPNPVLGALLIVLGLMKTYSDFMFSGHTATWVVISFFIIRYAHNRFLGWLYIAFNFVGPFLLVAVEEHYLADVIVGALVGFWTFVGYHLLNDDRFLTPFRGLWSIRMDKNAVTRIVYPIMMIDAEGNKWEIGGNRKDIVQLIGGNTNPQRLALWRLIKWFDGDMETKPKMRLLRNGNEISSKISTRKRVEYNKNDLSIL